MMNDIIWKLLNNERAKQELEFCLVQLLDGVMEKWGLKVIEILVDYEANNWTCRELEVIITPDLTEISDVSELSWNGRVEVGFRIIEEGTADCDKADIEFITPRSCEFGILISSADWNFPFL